MIIKDGVLMKKVIPVAILATSLVFGAAFVSSTQTQAKESTNVEKSVTDKGVTFTINNYSVTDNKLLVNYTVESDKDQKLNNSTLIEKPDISINGQRLNVSDTQSHKKVNGKYQGVEELVLPKGTSDNFDLTFNTDSILNTEGKWTIEFPVNE